MQALISKLFWLGRNQQIERYEDSITHLKEHYADRARSPGKEIPSELYESTQFLAMASIISYHITYEKYNYVRGM